MSFRSLVFVFLAALPFASCSDDSSKPEIKSPAFVEINQPTSLTAFNSPDITFSLKAADGSVYTGYNKTVTFKRRLFKNEGCPGDAKSQHEENIDLNFISGVAKLDSVFERPGRYLLSGTIPEWNILVSTAVEVGSSLPFEFQGREFIRAGQTSLGKVKKTVQNSDLEVSIKWLNPSGLSASNVSLTDGSEREVLLDSAPTVLGEVEFQVMDAATNRYFPCRLNILSGRIQKVELAVNDGIALKFFDEYGNQFLDAALMKYSIVRSSDSQAITDNVSWIDGRAGYKLRDQIPAGDYSIKLQFKESGEKALGSEVTVPFTL